MILRIIKRIVYALCLIYTINIFISTKGIYIPINYYTIFIISIYGILGIIVILLVKYVF